MEKSGPAARLELVRRAKLILIANAARRVPAAVIARHLGCSLYHLSRSFKQLEGMTMTAFRVETRLQIARSRLDRDPATELTRLALETGYCSHSHFTAAFRHRFGIAPSGYAAALPAGAPPREPARADGPIRELVVS